MKNYKLRADEVKRLVPPMGAALATDLITVGGHKVGFMYREEPENSVDSGWRFMTGHESQVYLDDPANLAFYEVNTIANYDPAIIPYLHLPIGSELERNATSDTFDLLSD